MMKTIAIPVTLCLAAGCNGSSKTGAASNEVAPAPPAAAEKKAVEEAPKEEAPKRCVVKTEEPPPPAAEKAEECPTDPVFGGVTLETARVTFPDAPGKPTITAELAKADKERARGLMYRTQLAENRGMLFEMGGAPRVQSFWMRNTCIPLDMMFIEADGFIAGILENVPPLNDDRRSVPCPVSYVLEVNAGWSRANGVEAGQKVILPKP